MGNDLERAVERIEHPEAVLKLEQEVDVIVHHFDPRSKKLTFHLAPSPEHASEEPQKIVRNALVKAEVVKGEAMGVLVRLLGVTGRAARGFIPGAQTGTARGTDLRKVFKPGTILDLKVVDLDPRSGASDALPPLVVTVAKPGRPLKLHAGTSVVF